VEDQTGRNNAKREDQSTCEDAELESIHTMILQEKAVNASRRSISQSCRLDGGRLAESGAPQSPGELPPFLLR
jgi:hypothetical protein